MADTPEAFWNWREERERDGMKGGNEMQKSESIAELAKALAKAQGEMEPAKKGSENPYYRSKYADLSQVMEAIRKPLSANGLAVSQLIQPDSEEAIVETILMHESGEWLSSIITLKPVKADPQGLGSAITYARRYALSAIVGLATEEDDDAEKAMGHNSSSSSQVPAQKQTNPQSMVTTEQLKTFWGSLKKLGWSSDQVHHRLGIKSLKNDWLAKGKTLTEAYDLITKTSPMEEVPSSNPTGLSFDPYNVKIESWKDLETKIGEMHIERQNVLREVGKVDWNDFVDYEEAWQIVLKIWEKHSGAEKIIASRVV
jgi:hypothetical protein